MAPLSSRSVVGRAAGSKTRFAPLAGLSVVLGTAQESGAGIAVQPAGRGANCASTGCMEETNCERTYALGVSFKALILLSHLPRLILARTFHERPSPDHSR